MNQDLERYHSALDRALMAFHGSKMSDINKVVRELWQRTYRGQDIDYIQIRSDEEGNKAGRTTYIVLVVHQCSSQGAIPVHQCSSQRAILVHQCSSQGVILVHQCSSQRVTLVLTSTCYTRVYALA